MNKRRRSRLGPRAIFCAALLLVTAACSSHAADRAATTSVPGALSSKAAAGTATPTSPAPTETEPSTSAPPTGQLHPRPSQLTPQGMWWGVDSTAPITENALDNVRHWYRGWPRPLVWGRYLTGNFRVDAGELAFARTHGIAVYLIVPDLDCSVCNGGYDICGNDRTADQARDDARAAARAAIRIGVPAGATLFKDVEQVGSCSGELTTEYLRAWYHWVRRTRYRVGFYGNTYRQSWDFPTAYCAALAAEPQFGRDVLLAQDEPEPAIGAARRRIGPQNAPPFTPYQPKCTPQGVTRIWQYGESLTNGNSTDVDEIVPGTHGLLAPDGTVT